ncbi:hypothetical protein E3E35_07955 [Thermococcus sp. GR7]|uniref:hypothetical protein n=1 Tax=unclassified Thermococcus TaxID=2627626 RepID=UPI0014305895|nr:MULTISPECIES: hypothetical protein [unclassified Thermococcus]NJE47332.1 hypothetical protein [Thermococcus sp. GR7]NJE79443.1 hypothetical protein [Thermococcus sp. GR4]NJF23178.1 hypothetical protein [Thermococcus sp. GR5]
MIVEKQLLRMYIYELHLQARFAQYAYNQMIRSLCGLLNLSPQDDSALKETLRLEVFYNAHSFLTHVANISKILAPDKGRKRKEILEELGLLEKELEIHKARRLRNHLEHYDERLEKWFGESKAHNYADMNIMPRSAIVGIDPKDFLRNLDPETLHFMFQAEDYDLQKLKAEVDLIKERCEAWFYREDTKWIAR